MIHKEDLEEARLLDGQLMLRWKAPRELCVKVMSAQEYHEMLKAFNTMISTVEQQFPEGDHRRQVATNMRKRWFP